MKFNDLNHEGICWAIEYIQTYVEYLTKQQDISDEEARHLLRAYDELQDVLSTQNDKW